MIDLDEYIHTAVFHTSGYFDPRPFGEDTYQVLNFLGLHGYQFGFFAGGDKLSPVPCFVIGRISKHIIGGFISSVIHI